MDSEGSSSNFIANTSKMTCLGKKGFLPTTAQLFLPLYNGKGKRLLYENLGSREISMYDHCDHLNGVAQLAFISRRPDCNIALSFSLSRQACSDNKSAI